MMKLLAIIPVVITVVSIITNGIWWIRDVNGYSGRIQTLESNTTALNLENSTTKTNLAVIANEIHDTKEQVHDIWQYLHLDRVKK